MSEPGPKVLYIAGWGRSGSTILDSLLGQLEGFVSTGELRKLWTTTLRPEYLCACGRPVAECPFWTRVRAAMTTGEDAPSPQAIVEFQERRLRLRPRPLARLVRGTRGEGPAGDPYRNYARTLDSLYRALAGVAGARVIVDSSKVPADARLLATLVPTPVYVVHLVRDPRAVAYSWWARALRTPDVRRRLGFGPLTSSARWTAWNGAIEALVRRRLPQRYLRVRYEDFIAAPQQTVRQILELLAEPREDLPFTGERSVRLAPNHMIQGNPRSRAFTGETELKLDDEWRAKLGPWRSLTATLPALPLARRYGYGVIDGRSRRSSVEPAASVREPADSPS